MLTKIAIVGRPNVGKSTLFNKLSGKRNAIASDEAGLTRDRQYITIQIEDKFCDLIDTGGLSYEDNIIDDNIKHQVQIAVDEADIILFMLNSQEGLNPLDNQIANYLRKYQKPIILVANKSDNLNNPDIFDFFSLGLGDVLAISAEHNKNLVTLRDEIYKLLPTQIVELEIEDYGIKLAVLGKPNVGKSTLVNKMLGEDRVVVADEAGITRDSIYIPFIKNDIKYTLIDTAGIRRKRSVNEKVEKFSIVKALDAVKFADIILLIIDASEGVSEQDASLLGIISENYKSVMIIINKWDGLDDYQKNEVKRKLDLKLKFINYTSTHFISALHGSGVGKLFGKINEIYQTNSQRFSTSKLNKILELANNSHKAPPVAGKRLKLKYVYQEDVIPPKLIFFGNHLQKVPSSYQRFLQNLFIRELGLKNTPIKFEFRSGENPFKDKKNTLSERQIKKKRRMMKFVKKGR
jgi:GTP-binding protein